MLFKGHDVGDDLRWVALLREAIDDGHVGIFGHFDEALMVSGAQHDCIDIARQNARGIGHAFAVRDVGAGGIHDDCLAAELAHCHIERYSCAHRDFFKHHSEHVIFARAIVIGRALGFVAAILFALLRVIENLAQGIFWELI